MIAKEEIVRARAAIETTNDLALALVSLESLNLDGLGPRRDCSLTVSMITAGSRLERRVKVTRPADFRLECSLPFDHQRLDNQKFNFFQSLVVHEVIKEKSLNLLDITSKSKNKKIGKIQVRSYKPRIQDIIANKMPPNTSRGIYGWARPAAALTGSPVDDAEVDDEATATSLWILCISNKFIQLGAYTQRYEEFTSAG